MAGRQATQRSADPRPARTREALYDAVRALSAEVGTTTSPAGRDAPAITVNALVQRAGVSRSAFYAQFTDLDDLMVALLIDTFREIGTSDIAARHDPAHASARDLARESLTVLGEHFDEHRAFYTASLGWNVSVRTHQAIVAAFAAQVRETILTLDKTPAGLDADDASTYIGGGLVAVLTTWVSAADPAPIGVLVDRLLALLPSWLAADELREG